LDLCFHLLFGVFYAQDLLVLLEKQ